MKKILQIIFFALSCTTSAMAQPTLTATTSNPVVGTSFIYYNTNATTQGATGANITWDFSALTQSTTSTMNYVACSADPNCSSFPGTTVAGQQVGGATSYFITSSTKESLNGAFASSTIISFSNPEDFFRYPFTYNTSYLDTFEGSFTSNGVFFYRKGTMQVTGDAYGTLKLPNATFNSTLRVHRHEVYGDSSAFISLSYVTDIYTWYATGNKEILFSFSTLTATSNGTVINNTVSSVYTNQHPTGIADLNGIASSLQISPNPATEALNISFKPEQNTSLQIELLDITGRRVQEISNSYTTGEHTVKIDVSTLPKGMYILKLNNEGQNVTRKVNVI